MALGRVSMDLGKYWRELEIAHEQTVEAYKNQKLGELVIFGEFLNRIGIVFDESEVIQPPDDPPDIVFHGHNFEIIFSIGNRKPHEESKKELQRGKEEKNKDEVCYVDFKTSEKISFSQIFNLVESELNKKNIKYASKLKYNLNILVNIMQNKFPDLDYPFPDLQNLIAQGWRSVSVMKNQYVVVLYAKDSAPQFIKNIVQLPKLSPSLQWWTPKCWQKM
jgi:hypothetical protein